MSALYQYRARIERVVDGDTLDVLLDAGFDLYTRKRLRLRGVNTPEKNKAATKEAGVAAMIFTKNWLARSGASEWPIVVQTHESDAFGRWLATITTPDGRCLNDDIIAAGHGVPFMGPTHQD